MQDAKIRRESRQNRFRRTSVENDDIFDIPQFPQEQRSSKKVLSEKDNKSFVERMNEFEKNKLENTERMKAEIMSSIMGSKKSNPSPGVDFGEFLKR